MITLQTTSKQRSCLRTLCQKAKISIKDYSCKNYSNCAFFEESKNCLIFCPIKEVIYNEDQEVSFKQLKSEIEKKAFKKQKRQLENKACKQKRKIGDLQEKLKKQDNNIKKLKQKNTYYCIATLILYVLIALLSILLSMKIFIN